jgi:phenylacetate-coenzyme A ligase PaaK-like adenylate-forming protein
MYMEILKTDSDEPVSGSETGRIILTPFDKENIDINRYEIGDLGRFITEPCPCGRTALKFELLGRWGDIFKFATNYVNYNRIKSILADGGYAGNLQIVLEYTKNEEKDSMKIRVDKGADTGGMMNALTEGYPEINECFMDKTGIVTLEKTDSFIMSSAGGKVRNVVDLRK